MCTSTALAAASLRIAPLVFASSTAPGMHAGGRGVRVGCRGHGRAGRLQLEIRAASIRHSAPRAGAGLAEGQVLQAVPGHHRAVFVVPCDPSTACMPRPSRRLRAHMPQHAVRVSKRRGCHRGHSSTVPGTTRMHGSMRGYPTVACARRLRKPAHCTSVVLLCAWMGWLFAGSWDACAANPARVVAAASSTRSSRVLIASAPCIWGRRTLGVAQTAGRSPAAPPTRRVPRCAPHSARTLLARHGRVDVGLARACCSGCGSGGWFGWRWIGQGSGGALWVRGESSHSRASAASPPPQRADSAAGAIPRQKSC